MARTECARFVVIRPQVNANVRRQHLPSCSFMDEAVEITLRNLATDRQVRFENYQVLCAVQALFGAVTPNMVAITLQCVGSDVHLNFYLERETSVDREEIEDVIPEMEALQFAPVSVSANVVVVEDIRRLGALPGRPVFRRLTLSR